MATLSAQTKLTVSDIVADAIALDVTMSPTVIAGGITSKTLTSARATGSALTVVEATYYADGTIIYLRNMSATETISVELTSGTTHLTLGPTQWAVFPWKAATDIEVFGTASSENPQLEVGIFSAA
jgi:hypothetical protein|tara:strand:- start:1611 stop:1988 length:378 start_codon:yes stop_codon:yes gene_type:complete